MFYNGQAGRPYALAFFQDVNGDGRQDLLLAGGGGVVLLRAREGGGFDEVVITDQAATWVRAADLHNRGRPSVLVGLAEGVLGFLGYRARDLQSSASQWLGRLGDHPRPPRR